MGDKAIDVEQVLDAIFPSDYYSGDTEPVGKAITPNAFMLDSLNLTPAFGDAAENLRTMKEIYSNFLELGLDTKSANDICYGLQSTIQIVVVQASMLSHSISCTGGEVKAHFRYDDESPFGLKPDRRVMYNQQMIADVKETMCNELESAIENYPDYLPISKKNSSLANAGTLLNQRMQKIN